MTVCALYGRFGRYSQGQRKLSFIPGGKSAVGSLHGGYYKAIVDRPRQVQILCKSNRIDGATRMSRIWIIPENAEKPTSDKRKVAYSND